MLVWELGEQMVSIINIHNSIKEPTIGVNIIIKNQILTSGGYVKVRET